MFPGLRTLLRTVGRRFVYLSLFCLAAVARVAAQAHPMPMMDTPGQESWRWAWDANVFVGYNYQLRKFTDFDTVESQNWLMGAGERSFGRNRLRFHSMLSFEPFTIQALGSPEVFQTGETY